MIMITKSTVVTIITESKEHEGQYLIKQFSYDKI